MNYNSVIRLHGRCGIDTHNILFTNILSMKKRTLTMMMKQTSTSTGQTKMKMIKLLLRGHVEPRYPGSCQTPPHRRRLRFHLYRFPFCPYRHSTLLLPTTTTNTYSLTLRLRLYSPSPRLIRAEQTDEDDNTDIEENEIEPDEQPKSILTAKLRCYSVDTPPSSFPPNTTVSDKSPITPSTTTAPATNSKAKASRGGRGRGRGRART